MSENPKVLLIDDDLLPTQYYYYALRVKNFDVEHCLEADLARDKWKEFKPDLVVLDMMMPPGIRVEAQKTKEGLHSGLLLYEWLRRDFPLTPVVVLTHLLSAGALFPKDAHLRIVQKAHLPPTQLPVLAEEMLRKP
jgi:DNA-binding response OmpR family regulator